jgi:uncharacterized BrkB/YihY/UPF0761 family membrane protein
MVDKTIVFGAFAIISIILLFGASTSESAINEVENIDLAKVNLISTFFVALLIIICLFFIIIFYYKTPNKEKNQ